MAKLLIIQHVPHEHAGAFRPAFAAAGCSVTTLRAAEARAAWPAPEAYDGIVSMGGPQSVYEQAAHPYLKKELALLKQAVASGVPVLGICLGAQLLAAALGAAVAKNPAGKEIGWYPLMREPGADGDPLCEPFGQTETVFQWHGDGFALPKGAVRLFSSPLCAEQGFRFGSAAYGLQFHVEVTEAIIRTWLSVNAAELARLKGVIDPAAIRAQNPRHLPRMQELSRHVASAFCALVSRRRSPSSRRSSHARV